MTNAGILAAVVAATALCAPTLAGAVTMECKPNFTSPMVLSTSDVESSWRTAVTNTYDASWADFSRAKNKKYHDLNLALAVMHYVVAQPCRPWRPAVKLNSPNGVLMKAP